MFFQGRGTVFLAERDSVGALGQWVEICPDTFSIALATNSFEHINKCGPVDTPDYRGTTSSSGTLSFTFADQSDANFALGVLGAVVAGGSGTATDEALATSATAGGFSFVGGNDGHLALTALVLKDHATSPGTTLVLDTDYTFNAATGRVTWLVDVVGPITASYGYTDTASVTMLSGAQKEYSVRFEFINKANANNPGSLRLYRVRFDPAKTVDMMSDALAEIDLTGSVLADLSRPNDDQFGRRTL